MSFSLASLNAAYLSHFGEQVTYTSRNGVTRSIMAVVDRRPPTPISEQSSTLAALSVVAVRNTATSIDDDDLGGISAEELDLSGNDTITIALRVGGTAEARPIKSILEQDAGFLHLEVR